MGTTKRTELDEAMEHRAGIGCSCGAYGSCECSCGACADWEPKAIKLTKAWYNMKPAQLRQHLGELTAQEIRSIKAVLNHIIRNS